MSENEYVTMSMSRLKSLQSNIQLFAAQAGQQQTHRNPEVLREYHLMTKKSARLIWEPLISAWGRKGKTAGESFNQARFFSLNLQRAVLRFVSKATARICENNMSRAQQHLSKTPAQLATDPNTYIQPEQPRKARRYPNLYRHAATP